MVREDINQHQPTYQIAEKKQDFENSCGAASLLCAAKELGITDLPIFQGSLSEISQNGRLELDNRSENDIYRISSGATLGPRPQLSLMKAKYSLPHNLALAGRLLGLEVEIFKNPGYMATFISRKYAHAVISCEGSNVPIHHTAPRPLRSNQRTLQALVVKLVGIPVGLHWVMRRPDGSYMDPGVGKSAGNFQELQSNANRFQRLESNLPFTTSYSDSGISMVFTRQNEITYF